MGGTLLLVALLALPAAPALDAEEVVPPLEAVETVALPLSDQASDPTSPEVAPAPSALSVQPVLHPLVEAIPDLPIHPASERPPPPARGDAKAERLDRAAGLHAREATSAPGARLSREHAPPTSLSPLASSPAWPHAAPRVPPPPSSSSPHAARAASDAAPPPARWEPAASAAAAAGLAIALLAPLLYHRLRGKALLSGQRAEILALLQARPGLAAADIARRLTLDPTTVIYHLRILAREKLVAADGRHYFAAGSVPAPEDRARLLAIESAGSVLEAVRASPGASKTALAAQLAIARPTLTHHLARLEAAGLVRLDRAGRLVRVFPKESLS